VPINSLEEGGTPPEEGDKVQFSVDATVKSVSGSNAEISIDAINGEPVSEEAGETPEEEAGEEGQEGGAPPGAGGAGGGPSGPASGASPGPGLGLTPGLGRNRANVPGVLPGESLAAMGARLRKGSKGRPMPF
jgi:hypothetical protein